MTDAPNNPPRRTGKNGTWRVLTAAQYAAETGRGSVTLPVHHQASDRTPPVTPSPTEVERLHCRLVAHAAEAICVPPKPPKLPLARAQNPLSLASAWLAMWYWAGTNGCQELLRNDTGTEEECS